MIEDRPGRLRQGQLFDIQRELREHAARQPTIEQLQQEMAGLTDEQQILRLERLIAYLRRFDARQNRDAQR